MLVVGDSSVFIKFALVGKFESLRIFSPILVPPAVYKEVYSDGKYKPGSQEFLDAVKAGWIIKKKYTNEGFFNKLSHLHLGEREVLTLAYEIITVQLILLDDQDAVKDYNIYLKPRGVKRLSTGGCFKFIFKDRWLEYYIKLNQLNNK